MSYNKELEYFTNLYAEQENEILIVTSDGNNGASVNKESYQPSQDYLAYVDIASNELKKGRGVLFWFISKDDYDRHGMQHPFYFKKGTIYKLKVRESKESIRRGDKCPYFMVVEVIEKALHHEGLLSILEEYRKPIVITDVLGEFTLDKNLSYFDGQIKWCGENISAHMSVDNDDKTTWDSALETLRFLCGKQDEIDSDLRKFAAQELTELANDWAEDDDEGDGKEISEEDFASRLELYTISVSTHGYYTAWYDDDDMFWGHSVTVFCNTKTGTRSAQIEG